MNQSIIFNNDISFDEERHAWTFTGLLGGDLITVVIDEKYHSRALPVTDEKKFDWEILVETWLEEFEPVGNEILLRLTL